MKLIDILRTEKCLLKIGSKSGFFYCGESGDIARNDLHFLSERFHSEFSEERKYLENFLKPEKFESFWEKELKRKTQTFLESVKEEYDNIDVLFSKKKISVVAYKNECEKLSKWKETGLENVRKKVEEDKAKTQNRCTERLALLTKTLDNWTDFEDRKVKDFYPSIDPSITEEMKICILEGIEVGDYWTVNEYRKGENHGKE